MSTERLFAIVVGRMEGNSAAGFVQGAAENGGLSLDHVVADKSEFTEARVEIGRGLPMLVPMNTHDRARKCRLTAHSVGIVR